MGGLHVGGLAFAHTLHFLPISIYRPSTDSKASRAQGVLGKYFFLHFRNVPCLEQLLNKALYGPSRIV